MKGRRLLQRAFRGRDIPPDRLEKAGTGSQGAKDQEHLKDKTEPDRANNSSREKNKT